MRLEAYSTLRALFVLFDRTSRGINVEREGKLIFSVQSYVEVTVCESLPHRPLSVQVRQMYALAQVI